MVVVSLSQYSFDIRTVSGLCEGKAPDVYQLSRSRVEVSMVICSQHVQCFEIKKDAHSTLYSRSWTYGEHGSRVAGEDIRVPFVVLVVNVPNLVDLEEKFSGKSPLL